MTSAATATVLCRRLKMHCLYDLLPHQGSVPPVRPNACPRPAVCFPGQQPQSARIKQISNCISSKLWTIGQASAGVCMHARKRHAVKCRSAASMIQDPADVIPDPNDDDDDEDDPNRTTPANTPMVLIGAGCIGLLTAMYLAKRGYTVSVFEKKVHPLDRNPLAIQDYLLVLSARALLAFEELGATELSKQLVANPLKGWWRMMGHSQANGTPSQPVLESCPDSNDRYKRRVLTTGFQLEAMLLAEAQRMFPDKITIYYQWEFKKVDWDKRYALVSCTAPSTDSSQATSSNNGAMQTTNALQPAMAQTSEQDEMWVPYGLLVGADGADSPVRNALLRKKPKPTDFDVQRPMTDTQQFKSFVGLPQVPSDGEALQGMSSHNVREYEYIYTADNAPTVRLWVSEPGQLSGIISGVDRWEASSLMSVLQSAYGSSMPFEWMQGIIHQTCEFDNDVGVIPGTVQCSQFHGPRIVLVGDAAHAMTTECQQGINCAVESVRLLNLALKSTNDSVDRALNLFSEVRTEDVHSMQQLEFFQRSTSPGLTYNDFVHKLAGFVGMFVWKCTMAMMSIANSLMPERFPPTYVQDRLWDARKGYSDLLKVLLRFAAVPILAGVALLLLLGRVAINARLA